MLRPRRSVLFLPASNPRAIDKARTLACDVVVLDLEDAVGPEAKTSAREAAVAAVAEGFGDRETAIRVNALDTPWGAIDLAAAAAAGPDVVLAPKIGSAAAVEACDRALAGAREGVRLWAMIETPAALLELPAIAACAGHTRLDALVLGVNDLSLGLGARSGPGREPLKPAMSWTVAAARAHGLTPIDGVFNRIDDPQGFADECAQGRAFGFAGKSLIHPSQIDPCNVAFSPDAAELAWARSVVEAFEAPEAAGAGVLRVDGAMAERLHLEQAKLILALHEATRTP